MQASSCPLLRIAFGVVAALGAASMASATPPGDLDPTFGSGGRVVTDFLGEEHARAVVVQPDGKIVVGGTRFLGDNLDFALARYQLDGTLDPTFGSGGRVTTDFSAGDDQLTELLLQPDGKIVAIGERNFGTSAMARYEPDGSLDPTFGSGGRVFDFTTRISAQDVARQPDGKLVVVGSRNGDDIPSYDFAVLRYDADGTLDPTFGTGGIVTTNFPDNLQDGARAVALQPDGAIVAVGYTITAAHTSAFGVARYTTSGSLDPSFGSGGLVRFLPGTLLEAYDVVVEPGGTLLVAGNDGLARLLPDGSLDGSFGTGGLLMSICSFARSVAIDAAGSFVLGCEYPGAPLGSQLKRRMADGSPDVSFGVDGAVPLHVFDDGVAGTRREFAVALAPTGEIVVAGTEPDGDDFVVTRYAGDHVVRCSATPAADCRAPIAPRRSSLVIDQRHGKRKLTWHWAHGEATSFAEFGDPTAGDSAALCVYDESGSPTLTHEMLAPSGGVCDGAPCWRNRNGRKLSYADDDGTPLGMTRVDFKPGAAGKADLRARADGAHDAASTLPASLPIRVQLQTSAGACLEATFSSVGTKRNDAATFQGKSD